ncbi:hypothetical protein C1I94_09905 [Akkermansia muciniphila]|nr:hypothetical protein CUC06_09245 [Akkermansia muciniphila]PNC73802.1 hypothetical protein CXU04_02105 [Akkermansia muciniphila]QAA41870.1 hypothetical protein C1I94_09905 [Akkermansia muciniphila]QAA44165.1 hypothetical protein C1I96_09520 [Akkermansia muciniphila]QAA46205.1 hypothetical protein C1O37_08060 [Akkermansia muciniphila]
MDEEGGIQCGGSPRQNYGDFHGRKNGREGSFEPVPSDGRQTVEGSFLSTFRNGRGVLPEQKA